MVSKLHWIRIQYETDNFDMIRKTKGMISLIIVIHPIHPTWFIQLPKNNNRIQQWYPSLCSPLNVILIFYRHTLRHMVDLVYSNQSTRELEHVVPQRDDDKLCVFGSFLDVRCYNRDLGMYVSKVNLTRRRYCTYISKIKSCVNLVHYIQGRWLIVMQSKHQCQTAQCLFTTTQV